MASLVLAKVDKVEVKINKTWNVSKGTFQPQHHIIKCNDREKLRIDDYLAISVLILFSYVVGVDA